MSFSRRNQIVAEFVEAHGGVSQRSTWERRRRRRRREALRSEWGDRWGDDETAPPGL
jgi:hypothetical protein